MITFRKLTLVAHVRYYTSNCEAGKGAGGVFSIEFDEFGDAVDYFAVCEGTSRNCGGGKTPWDTWISCEEDKDRGLVYECDPSGERAHQLTYMVPKGGRYESAAFYTDDKRNLVAFTTHDHERGALV